MNSMKMLRTKYIANDKGGFMMNNKKCLVVGNNCREATMAYSLMQNGCVVYAVLSHENPTITSIVNRTGGKYIVGNQKDGLLVSRFAVEQKIDIAIVSSDAILEAGVVDYLREASIPTFGATKEGAKIEWSKIYARNLVNEVDSSFNPKHSVINSVDELEQGFDKFIGQEVVVKPDGLTGGKGVKVMGEHLKSVDEAYEYAKAILKDGGNVLLEEKIEGFEFTIMGITDGHKIVVAPVTYDYSYRFDGDEGPGTGGMGCFTLDTGRLPCLTQNELNACQELMQKVLNELNKKGIIFNGVLNGGFFKLKDGSLRLMEFNARFGDPEVMNVLAVMETPFIDLIEACINGSLSQEVCKFKREASIVVYAVSKDYPSSTSKAQVEFSANIDEIQNHGANIFFGSCIKSENGKYLSVGTSRLAAVVMAGNSLEDIRNKTYEIINKYIIGNLDWRNDIGSKDKLIEMGKYI